MRFLRKLMLAVLFPVAVAGLWAPSAAAQIHFGQFEIVLVHSNRETEVVGAVTVPSRSSGASRYMEYWYVAESYENSSVLDPSAHLEIRPVSSKFADERDFVRTTLGETGWHYREIQSTEADIYLDLDGLTNDNVAPSRAGQDSAEREMDAPTDLEVLEIWQGGDEFSLRPVGFVYSVGSGEEETWLLTRQYRYPDPADNFTTQIRRSRRSYSNFGDLLADASAYNVSKRITNSRRSVSRMTNSDRGGIVHPGDANSVRSNGDGDAIAADSDGTGLNDSEESSTFVPARYAAGGCSAIPSGTGGLAGAAAIFAIMAFVSRRRQRAEKVSRVERR